MISYRSENGIDMWEINNLSIALIEGSYMEIRLWWGVPNSGDKASRATIKDLVRAIFDAEVIEDKR
jgi:hypothetical protein